MLAKRVGDDEYHGIIPERILVHNEIVTLLVLHREGRYLSAFEIEVAVVGMRGGQTKSVQITGSLRRLLEAGLTKAERFFSDDKTKRTVVKYRLTDKGLQSAELFLELFKVLKG